MSRAIAGGLIGIVFGIVLCWSGMADPDVIRGALTFQSAYLFLFFGSAVAVAAAGIQLVKRLQTRALLIDAPVAWARERPTRAHVTGAVIFGTGWAIADACPGPILAQLGQGVPWAVFTFVGAASGVYLYMRAKTVETEPATDRESSSVTAGTA